MNTTQATQAYKEIAAKDLKVGDVYASSTGEKLLTGVKHVEIKCVNIRWNGGIRVCETDETVCINTTPQHPVSIYPDIAVSQLRLGDAVIDGDTPKVITQLTLAEDGHITVRWNGGFFMCEPSVMVRAQPKAAK